MHQQVRISGTYSIMLVLMLWLLSVCVYELQIKNHTAGRLLSSSYNMCAIQDSMWSNIIYMIYQFFESGSTSSPALQFYSYPFFTQSRYREIKGLYKQCFWSLRKFKSRGTDRVLYSHRTDNRTGKESAVHFIDCTGIQLLERDIYSQIVYNDP